MLHLLSFIFYKGKLLFMSYIMLKGGYIMHKKQLLIVLMIFMILLVLTNHFRYTELAQTTQDTVIRKWYRDNFTDQEFMMKYNFSPTNNSVIKTYTNVDVAKGYSSQIRIELVASWIWRLIIASIVGVILYIMIMKKDG